jgi:hypothetical protein
MEKGYEDCIGKPSMSFDYGKAIEAFYHYMDLRKYKIESKMGPMWEDEQKAFDEMEHLGATMILHYSLWVPPYDATHQLTHAEQLFRVPLPGTDKVCYEGRFDGIVRADDGKLYVLEYKTTASLKRMSGVFRGIQATMYTWAASLIFGEPVHGVVYRVLWKKVPAIPKLTTQQRFSRAKGQKLTRPWVEYCLEKMAHKRAAKAVEDADDASVQVSQEDIEQAYQRYLSKLTSAAYDLYGMLDSKPNEFFMHRRIPRGQTAIKHAVQALTAEGLRMRTKDVPIYPITGFHCTWCQYRDPCDLMEADMNEAAEAVLLAEYDQRTYWENDLEEG